MTLLETVQSFLLMFDRCLELLDVLRSALSKGSLSLPISLLSFFGCCIDLISLAAETHKHEDHTGFRPPFLF